MKKLSRKKAKGKVLVTGTAGFIGSHLVRALCEKGEHVKGLVLPGEDIRALENLSVHLIRGDITDKASLAPARI